MSNKQPTVGVELELATTSQIMAELAKRNKKFIMVYDSGSGVTKKDNTMECHVSGLNPQETFNLLQESTLTMGKLLIGEKPDNMTVQLMTIDKNGEYEIIDMPIINYKKLFENMTEEEKEEEKYDPWGEKNKDDSVE